MIYGVHTYLCLYVWYIWYMYIHLQIHKQINISLYLYIYQYINHYKIYNMTFMKICNISITDCFLNFLKVEAAIYKQLWWENSLFCGHALKCFNLFSTHFTLERNTCRNLTIKTQICYWLKADICLQCMLINLWCT